MAGSCFATCEDAFVIRLPCRDDIVEDSGEFVGGVGVRTARAETGSQAAEILSEVRLAAMQRLGCHAQGYGKAADYLAGFH